MPKYLYTLKANISFDKGLEDVNRFLKENVGFTLKAKTNKKISILNFTMDTKNDYSDEERVLWEEEVTRMIVEFFEKESIKLLDPEWSFKGEI